MNLSKFFLDNYKFTLILTALVVVFGLGGLKDLNSESYPAVDFASATITTRYDGASAEEMETRITKPIEDEIRSVSGLKDVRSVSQAGESTIFVRLDIDNVNVKEVMADLQRSVDRVSDLPPDLRDRPRFLELKSEEFPVIDLAIVGPNTDRKRDLIAEQLQEAIENNKSVLNVRLTAHQERQFRVQLDPAKLEDNHVGVNEVIQKIQEKNINIPGGLLKNQNQQKLLRLEGKIENVKNLENIVIRSNFSGQKILLKDVAQVIDAEEDPTIRALHNGQEATLLIVTKKSGADTLALVESIDSTIEKFRSSYPEYQFKVYNNEAEKVKNRLEVLTSNAVSGLVLVVVFLLIFLPGRVGIMASLSLPIAVLATFGFMPVFGMNLNAITILALVIALGMLVDNSVVISENYARLRKDGMGSRKAALTSISKLWLPISATAFTTIAAFLPMLVTRGIMGQFIKWIPVVVTIALVASLIESFFFLPMRLVENSDQNIVDEDQKQEKSDWFQRGVIEPFERMMAWVIHHRYITATIFSGLMIGSFYMMFGMNKFVLFPSEQTEVYIGRFELPKGTPLLETERKMATLTKNINDEMGDHITSIVAQAGVSQTAPGDPQAKSGDNVGFFRISVDEFAKNNIDSNSFRLDLEKVSVPTDAAISYEALANGPPVGKAVNGTIRSSNPETLETVTNSIIETLNSEPGIKNVEVNDIYGDNRVYLDINEEVASRLGLTVQSIGNIVRSSVSGSRVSNVDLKNREVDILVELAPEYRADIKDLNKIKIMDPRGYLIPLSQVAKFREEAGKPQINRFDFQRAKTITADVDEAVITALKANQIFTQAFNKLQETYPDTSIVFGGEEESTNESLASLFDALILSLIGIFALLVFLFRSYLRPLIIMTTIPLGLVGFSIAFYLHDRPISFLALIGIIGLGGIIVNSGIVLISFIEDLKQEDNGLTMDEVLVKSSGLRLRAVVVSSLTTISGLLPTAYGIGGSDAILIPMTLAMAWGLTSGTVLTLVWVPCAYGILEDASGAVKRMTSRLKRAKMGKSSMKNQNESNDTNGLGILTAETSKAQD
ncbi:efflux RND transporter permease subunit [Pseudobacteriovorax antillogorgiicola]|uniref:Multidrug efflux pump subunit AcrB n=1 Tax=Pseudobacteriovorax antillogorgiicola TaxID=1513793 RepID=A0A1Y6BQK5_9BACT|nr:efflux RND transporter permease subunit [Pseudobacteriovorax antillogorgiicola]TCS53802.1 multidrug efflux pump subunit AcrB [Pseudobacteriovorax antillogorgiicola]SMF22116.1 Multidrug efflux pump subunit AcrB [Pseudobacteriovorax antillogorgiicola]